MEAIGIEIAMVKRPFWVVWGVQANPRTQKDSEIDREGLAVSVAARLGNMGERGFFEHFDPSRVIFTKNHSRAPIEMSNEQKTTWRSRETSDPSAAIEKKDLQRITSSTDFFPASDVMRDLWGSRPVLTPPGHLK